MSIILETWCNEDSCQNYTVLLCRSIPVPVDQRAGLPTQQQTQTGIHVFVILPLRVTMCSYLFKSAVLLTGYYTIICHKISKLFQCSSYGTHCNDTHNSTLWHRSHTLQATSLKFLSTNIKSYTLHLFFPQTLLCTVITAVII